MTNELEDLEKQKQDLKVERLKRDEQWSAQVTVHCGPRNFCFAA
jgi:hypothetical protein